MACWCIPVSGALNRIDRLAVLIACLSCGILPCNRSEASDQPFQVPSSAVRDVRVLIASGVERIRLRTDGVLSVVDDKNVSLHTQTAHTWIIASSDESQRIRFGNVLLPAGDVVLRPKPPGLTTLSIRRAGDWSADHHYPGALRLLVREDGRLNVINMVDVERYVACVVAKEVWPSFDREAYRAQAIAARTFILFHMQRRNGAAFDVTATQRSQVYRGVGTDGASRRGAEAASETSGIVLTWRDGDEDRLFCTYYSAACGGMSQSAAIFGPENDIAPLSGGVRCDYCKIAPGQTYRWGPVRVDKARIRSQLVSAYPELASLGRIRSVEVLERTPGPGHRPLRLRITGRGGESHDMLAERFRLAIDGSEIRSTDFSLRVTRREVIFENGRGFGHGLGLCQWGMQGQALAGKRAGEILSYYYPGARLTRVY